MAYLWQQSIEKDWFPTEIRGTLNLSDDALDSIKPVDSNTASGRVLLYAHHADQNLACWILLSPQDSQVRLNSQPIDCGIRVLADRDAIQIPGLPSLYFSTERLARIESFNATDECFCPRCKLPISENDLAVCCPQCGVWHHMQSSEGQSCWSYAETCALCDQSTDLESAGFRWTPEEL